MRRTRLIQRRLELNMTQEEVAEAIGVSRTAYVRYETGTRMPPIDVASKIAAVLGTSLDFLFVPSVPIGKQNADTTA